MLLKHPTCVTKMSCPSGLSSRCLVMNAASRLSTSCCVGWHSDANVCCQYKCTFIFVSMIVIIIIIIMTAQLAQSCLVVRDTSKY